MSFFKNIWRSNSKHQKLCEEWALANNLKDINMDAENENESSDDVTFLVKYLGSTLIDSPRSEQATADAVTSIISMAKVSGKKLPRVALSVSLKGIEMSNVATGEHIMEVSIYRISYCSADAAHDHVFAFIATNKNETMECHAMLCPKRKMAQAVTLTVAQSFNAAFQVWQSQEDKRRMIENRYIKSKLNDNDTTSCEKDGNLNVQSIRGSVRSLLIDFNADLPPKRCGETFSHSAWVSFDDENQIQQEKGNHMNLWQDNNRICS